MKLTWLGGTAIRLHIGGKVLVADPGTAPADIEQSEITSGADRIFSLADADAEVPVVDPASWRRRQPLRPLDAGSDAGPELVGISGGVLVDAAGEPPVALLLAGSMPPPGRWLDGAVAVLLGTGATTTAGGLALLVVARPRLLALALDEQEAEEAIRALRPQLDGCALVVLEPGMALEA
jgi:hypothetical protein